jgi:hypothetical protein
MTSALACVPAQAEAVCVHGDVGALYASALSTFSWIR